ncbi:hypothetical protein [Desulfosporosinus orientis]|uniref:hypothetical protein n=1 Tax=Desulfosporosinus orientis TaxID=1563 RepID=UPI0005A8EE89|nr:hypothetical protein [Desulfosporosinus orientis]
MLNFKKPAAWLLIISALAVLLLSVCLQTNPVPKLELPGAAVVPSLEKDQINESTRFGENIKKGISREVVLKIMGEPNFGLSGLRGDDYILENGSSVVFYYGADELVYDIKRSDGAWKPIGNADLNRDGLKESIYLDQSQ